jgi:hypothetical protein
MQSSKALSASTKASQAPRNFVDFNLTEISDKSAANSQSVQREA